MLLASRDFPILLGYILFGVDKRRQNYIRKSMYPDYYPEIQMASTQGHVGTYKVWQSLL
jgi:hypothetical protein